MNSPFMLRQADSLVAALEGKGQIREGIKTLYQKILSRAPDETEFKLAKTFLTKPGLDAPTDERWGLLVQALMISNEMLYID